MDIEAAVALVDREVYRHTQKHLTDLQQEIIIRVCQGQKYWEIADGYGCTEGHAKDTGWLMWQLLSQAWGKKVYKSNLRRLLTQQLKSDRIEDGQRLSRSRLTGLRRKSGETPFGFNSLLKSGNPPNATVSPRRRRAQGNARQDTTEPALTVDQPKHLANSQTNFVGRQQAIATLQDLVKQNRKIIVLQGEGGIGKTTFAQHFLANQGFDLVLEVLMAKQTSNIVAVASVVEEWLERDLNQASGKELGVTLARFKRYLEQHRVGILIDNLEPALDRDGRLISSHRDYLELLRILADSKVQSLTLITSRDRLCEAEINLEHYRLPGLDCAAWQQYFATHQITTSDRLMLQIHQTYGGNAKAMGILCGIIREDYNHDLEQYWQENRYDPLVETDLKNLVASQFERLQQLDPQAYQLLCRLGCYRYQDLAQVPQSGLLCLLWDVPKKQQRRVIKSLRNRSLLEFAQGNYYLHPVVQTEAQLRLQRSPIAWSHTQRQIATYLTQSVTRINHIQAGLTALEAYYHYLAIPDYPSAAKVILRSRENQWGQFLTLGTNLYRLGIIQPLLTAINQILERVEDERQVSELNNILGDLYWTTGKIHKAIACQQQTITTSQNCWRSIIPTSESRYDLYYWRMLEVDSLLSLGLYNLDLWELDTAADLFQRVINLANNTKHHSWSEKAALALALVKSSVDATSSPDYIVLKLYRLIVNLEDKTYNTGRFAYFMQILGQIFFNYHQNEPAKTIWQRAIAFAESSHYIQIKAKSLTGLGSIERRMGNFTLAHTYHQQAVDLLDQIAAKCDLAEGYFQWGITLQSDRQLTSSQDYFERAIAISQQIPAPKQVARIRLVMSNE